MPKSRRPATVAIYCPLWHRYDHMDSWKGEGWCEWELLKNAIPRFPGHHQPLQPSWGCFDESDPKWSEKEINLAADHGLDVFLFDWYWFSGVKLMEEALEHGFLKAPSRKRMKFAIMWANHNWANYFPPPFGKPWNMWLPSRHSAEDLERVIDYSITHYFSQPNYWQVDGRIFYSVFQPEKFVDELGGPQATRKLLARMDRKMKAEGLPPIHWNGMLWAPDPVGKMKEAGFHSTTTYVIGNTGKAKLNLTESYADVMEAHRLSWKKLAAAPLPHCPIVSMGWDVTPRCENGIPWPFPMSPVSGKHDYPYMSLVLGNTPELYEKLCRDARAFAEVKDSLPNAVFFNAWNEWTEGSYLLPEKKTGAKYLEAIKRAFQK